ncbi:MAG: LysM peptidoglycan-binding domain-containing protein [Anaerolineaceae bacterium]|nr:LysM peptidoglycan-binding domain-containing protein [Anaerolineaceae bacterium]
MRPFTLFLRIFVPLVLIVVSVLAVFPQAADAQCGVTHHVVYGDNLFRISLRYGVSMNAIAAANGIVDIRRIYAGQDLVIPCSGTTTQTSGYILITTTPAPYPTADYYSSYYYGGAAATSVPAGGLDCSGFRATSPDAFPDGSVTFYWDKPASADQIARYQVRIFDEFGNPIAAFEALNVAYSLSADVSRSAIGPSQGLGTQFSYYVVGVTADNRLCQTATRYVQREWPAAPPSPTPTP